ncbi:CRTAC1 family protein [Rhodohalobacter sp. SW132]|uniref:CRTAC1 family protein n=1 Tax=Rhodohalobacter sp. SW132 TaxID=2293433 RepID=UPI0013149492|nr:CRTAC1 family protein [Rhodohalobacter sp. SW132]
MYKIFFATLSLTFLSLFLFIGCSSDPDEVSTESEDYQQAISDFYVSLGASETQEARFAFNKMNDVAQAFPQEPAAWANLGVYAMRQGNFELADDRFTEARNLAPDHPDILFLSGLFESRRGDVDRAVEFLREAHQADPNSVMIQYSLIEALERQDDVANADEILERIESLKNQHPENQAVLFEAARIGAKEQNAELLQSAIESLGEFTYLWDDEAVEQYRVVSEVIEDRDFSELNFELTFLRNAVEPSPAFQQNLREIKLEPNEVGFLMQRFITLPMPDFRAADPDLETTFAAGETAAPDRRATLVKSVTLLEELPPFSIFVADGELHIDDDNRLPFPGDTAEQLPPSALAEIDYNYNFRNDIALAGSSGFRLFEQNSDETFSDITGRLNLPSSVTEGSYRGVWPADVDLDGDLDLVLAPESGSPFALRNNTDGTFTEINLFDDVENVIDFRWADLDSDGAADALFLTRQGELVIYRNERGGVMTRVENLPSGNDFNAVAISDIDANGEFDVLAVRGMESIERVFYNRGTGEWQTDTLVDDIRISQSGNSDFAALFSADIDNNGSLDIIFSTGDETSVWLSDSERNFSKLDLSLPGNLYSIFDIDGNDRLDLLGLESDGSIYELMNSGPQNYSARSIRARASGLEGDQRINSFGIGGEMEIRTGLLYQKQLISSPIVHFGLGIHDEAEMLRIIWPNGSVQAEFAELGMGSTIFNEQILKGSCPWLFTHDGEEHHFITDILWRSPLGLRINAQETAGVIQTLDRVRIPGDQLNPVDGIYDIRITAELWETHFFDYVNLVAVDHPEGSEIFVDERFVFPAPDLSTRAVSSPNPVARVLKQNGDDVTDTVSKLDRNYIKPFRKTSYQGLVEEHYIEIDLGEEPPADRPLYLVASGWLRPTDSSINLALSQGDHEPPAGLRVEVSDGNGGWTELHENYGVPAGKTKTILLELDNVFEDAGDRRVRLHTTSEIYWDALMWAEKLPVDQITETELQATKMDLRYRGFSEWNRANEVSPKMPTYGEISSTNQRWRDLVGYHTRFGDVTELLSDIDDRYVIMNAGDEIVLEYEAIDEPAPGYTRSYIFVSDGWVKDGDYNTEASKTVTPLPYHGQTDYDYRSGSTLLDDPVYQKHRSDWVNYHTRFVTPESFRSALLFE